MNKSQKEVKKFNTEIFANLECAYKERLNFGEVMISFYTKRTKKEGIKEKKAINGPWLDP